VNKARLDLHETSITKRDQRYSSPQEKLQGLTSLMDGHYRGRRSKGSATKAAKVIGEVAKRRDKSNK